MIQTLYVILFEPNIVYLKTISFRTVYTFLRSQNNLETTTFLIHIVTTRNYSMPYYCIIKEETDCRTFQIKIRASEK